MMNQKPLLSIGMIVKNEIRCLERCLKALQPLRDAISCELVIADTGSTDGTREIAEKYADILFDFEWINDFAAARNAVLSKCSGAWYFSVDADEYLKPDISALVNFLNSRDSKTLDQAMIVVRNHSAVSLDGYYWDYFMPRLVRRTSELHYEGTIHESFTWDKSPVTVILDHVILDHDGYVNFSEDYWKQKAERNLSLLENELEKSPQSLRVLQQCLDSAVSFPEKHAHYARLAMEALRAAEHDGEFALRGPVIARNAIAAAVTQKLPETEAWFLWTLAKFSQSIVAQVDINCTYMIYLSGLNRYEEACEAGQNYLAGVERYDRGEYSVKELMVGSLRNVHPLHRNKASLFTAVAASKVGDFGLIVKILCMVPTAGLDQPLQLIRSTMLNKVAQSGEAEADILRYTDEDHVVDQNSLCLAYDLLCVVCMRGKVSDEIADRFAVIGALFLQECYGSDAIENEESARRLPVLHRFTWHYVHAVERRMEGDWAGYVASLRKALNEADVMKPFVQFLLSDVQARQRREQIATAPPELLALAEQVRVILAAYPADDPAVVQLKQTLAYQQVAFLIEE